jgi:hypothetical protein
MTASFTSLYDATEDVDLGNGFSATVRKFLSEADFRAASASLVKNRKYREAGISTEVTGDFDPFAYNRTLVERALVSWNITKDNPNPAGEPLPIPIDDYKQGRYDLPQPAFRLILERVLTLNNEADKTPEDKVKSAQADADFRTED